MNNTKIELELQRVSRRLDALQKAQDLWVGDRNLLEDVLLRLEALERAIHMNREKQGEAQKDLKADLHELRGNMEDKIDGVEKTLSNKEMLIIKKDKFKRIKQLLKLK